jgi:hypothetical protein
MKHAKKIGRGRKEEMEEGKSVSAGYFVILILEFFFLYLPMGSCVLTTAARFAVLIPAFLHTCFVLFYCMPCDKRQ